MRSLVRVSSAPCRGLASRPLAAVAACVALSLAAPASAQYRVDGPSTPPSEAQIDEARSAFTEGAAFVEAGSWADALSRFERSYRLSGVPAALFNVATTLRSMGRHRDARDAFRQLLEIEDLDDETRATAQARMYEEGGRLAHVTVRGLEEAPDATVRVDGRAVPTPDPSLVELELDPGEHALLVEREGFHPFREDLVLEDGQRERVTVSLRAIERPAPIVVTEVQTDDAVWPVVGSVIAAVLIGAGIGIGFFLYDDAQVHHEDGFDGLEITFR